MNTIKMEDIAKLNFLSSPCLNEKASLLAYTVSASDLKTNSYKKYLYIYDLEKEESSLLENSGKAEAFIWDNADTLLVNGEFAPEDEPKKYEAKTVYYRISASTGEKNRAFTIPAEVDGIQKIKDGLYAVTAVIDKNAPPADSSEEELMESLDYHVIEEAPLWENGRGFIAGKRTVLHLYDEKTGSFTPITGKDTDVRSFTVSGNQIAVIGKEWQDTLQNNMAGLWIYDIESGKETVAVPQNTAKIKNVAFAGENLIYTCSDNQKYGLTQICDFWKYDITAGTSAMIAGHNGLAVNGGILSDVCYGGGISWKSAGEKVYFTGLKGYEKALYSIDLQGNIETVCAFAGGSVEYFDTDGKQFFLAALEKDSSMELYRFAAGEMKKLTALNADYFEDRFVSKTEYVPFVNSAGIEIDGWVLKPIDYDPEKTYPALYEIHGGPRCAYGTVFMHEMQVFASKGYFVFFCNPRGSEGRGEEFADIRGKHGTIDYEDLMEFMDSILAKFPQIDPKRVAASGGSYAGFMCNWIEGHTDRFAAIASQRSVSEFVEDFCVSDIGFTYDLEATGGNPWDNTEKLWFHSPYKYAPFAKTPILFIHSLCDYDCTIDQGVSMFQAMKYFGVPARMCLFEGENHELSRSGKPKHRIRRLKEIADWIDRYLS